MKKELPNKTLSDVNAYMHDWYAIDLRDKQIIRFGKREHKIWADLLKGCFDTVNREQMINVIVREVLGNGRHWPLYGEGTKAFEKFMDEWIKKAPAKGIELVK